MKTVRRILAIVLILCLIFALSACSNKKEKLIGTWKAEDGYSFTFNSDGTCKFGLSGITVDCTYKVDGDKLSITMNGETQSMTIDSVDDSKLVLIDGGEKITFTKQ